MDMAVKLRFRGVSTVAGAALTVLLSASPFGLVSADEGFVAQNAAVAMGNGNGGGNGNGNGGGNGNSNAGGNGNGGGNGNSNAGGNGNGKAFGLDKASGNTVADDAKTNARGRYNAALNALQKRQDRSDGGFGNAELTLTDAETDALIGQGWGAKRKELDDGFRNHGERVQFYLEMARALDLPNHFGPMWANFGTANENGLVDLIGALNAATDAFDSETLVSAEQDLSDAQEAERLAQGTVDALNAEIAEATAVLADDDASEAEKVAAQQRLDDATTDLVDAEGILADAAEDTQQAQDDFDEALDLAEAAESDAADAQAELDAAIADVKPGNGPTSGWEVIDLDQNGDGVVDEVDLALIEAEATTNDGS